MNSPYLKVLLLSWITVSHVRAESYERFLTQFCVRCHGEESTEQDFDIERLSRDFKAGVDSHLWAEVIERINSGEMPPQGEPQPSISEIGNTVSELSDLLDEGRDARLAARPAVAHYRLSRSEYQNTIYDLLGVRYDPTKPGELNEDTRLRGYDRIGSQLSLSPSHMDRYYQAAETVLSRAFPKARIEARKIRKTASELRYGGEEKHRESLARFGITRPLRLLLFPGRVQTALSSNWFGQTGPQHSGLYRVRLQASGIRPRGGQPAHLSIGKQTSEETVSGVIEFDVTAKEDTPEVFEFEVFLEMPTTLHFSVVSTNVIDRRRGAAFRNALSARDGYLFTHSSETRLLNPNAPQMFDDEGNGIFSTVLLDWIEWEGPLETPEELKRREGILPAAATPPQSIPELLRRFCERAWRREVKPDELEYYLSAYQSEMEQGADFTQAYMTALTGILTSRNFIYLIDGDETGRSHLTESELASRLSYFLWSSMPDSELHSAVQEGRLSRDEEKSKIVEQMLDDPKSERFVRDFANQWLQLYRVGMFPPDRTLYPRYDDWLETSLKEEPIQFFRKVLNENLKIDEFIHSNWTMANPRLCDFYGLPEPATHSFQPISLEPDTHRGGLLAMGGILSLTSDGTRHRPVHRGVWINETLFNRTPPPPPANVDPIEPVPPEGTKLTIRDRLKSHATQASCAACHQTIDPYGLAFDHYDAIGQWRSHERILTGKGDNPAVDASGSLPDGRSFKNSKEIKQLLVEDRDKIARALIEHLCTYALRRVLTVDDREDITVILNEAKQTDLRVKDIVRAVANSDLMRKR